jgi:hypothetical protein
MKRTLCSVALASALALTLSSCQSGPRRLSRAWDDWVNQEYSENAWVHGALLQDILPVYPIVGLFAWAGDILFVNTYYFWTEDAWDNRGTAYDHNQVEGAEKIVAGSGF